MEINAETMMTLESYEARIKQTFRDLKDLMEESEMIQKDLDADDEADLGKAMDHSCRTWMQDRLEMVLESIEANKKYILKVASEMQEEF